jgi:multiple sugar transport system ATP-binding protein
VNKTFPGGGIAAADLTLEIADGELLVILGPSGCGKSTVLRLIAGLESPTSGRIVIGDRDVTEVPPQQRDLAMVFQNYALYPHKTVRENLAFSLRVRRSPQAQIDERVEAAAAMLDITPLLDRRPAQLSGGQRQRVALGRALVREPRAFLLDEPLSNLDPVLRVGTRAELALLHRRLGSTMVYVTHDQEEAMTLGTRIAVMREGRIQQVAAPLDVFQRPANTFVAGFVGSPAMNLWACNASAAGAEIRVATPAFTIDSGAERRSLRGLPDEIGVRPYDIELTVPGEGDGRGRIEVVEPLGATTIVHLRAEGTSHQLVRVGVSSDIRADVGESVGFRLRRDRLHLFQAGRRVG